MIRIVRRVKLLTVLALLASGMFQPLSAAHGLRCARSHAAANEVQPGSSAGQPGATHESAFQGAVSGDHHQIPDSGSDPAVIPAAPCVVAALPTERSALLHAFVTRTLLSPLDLPPTSLLVRTLFRPPRLS